MTQKATTESQSFPIFPKIAITGTLGELAQELSAGTEVSEEFVFVAAISYVGAAVSGYLKLNIGTDSRTNLYSMLLGSSADAKKSTALHKVRNFMESCDMPSKLNLKVVDGVGSAEGLAKELQKSSRVLLFYDELRALMEKTKIQASALLPMVTSLFEGSNWSNSTKDHGVEVKNVHLSLIGCCTPETYEKLWSTEAISIGLPNRFVVVTGNKKDKVAWPRMPDTHTLDALRVKIQQQLALLPKTFDITDDAKVAWEKWYYNLPSSECAKRLDAIGFRLLPIFAMTMDKSSVDLQVIDIVTQILDYEFHLRKLIDPIDADTLIARLEEKIRRQLGKCPMTLSDLKRQTNASRSGYWAFNCALENLKKAGEIAIETGTHKYYLIETSMAMGIMHQSNSHINNRLSS